MDVEGKSSDEGGEQEEGESDESSKWAGKADQGAPLLVACSTCTSFRSR